MPPWDASADYPSGSQQAAVVRSIETFGRFLVEGNIAGWLTYWAEDGVLMPPGHPRVIGRENIEAYVRANFAGVESMTLSNWEVDTKAISRSQPPMPRGARRRTKKEG